MMKTITYGKYLQLEKYYNLDEAISEVCPELLGDTEIKMLKEKLYWARKNLGDAVYARVEPDYWED